MVIECYKKTKPLGRELTDFIVTEILFDSNKKKMANFVVLQLFYCPRINVHDLARSFGYQDAVIKAVKQFLITVGPALPGLR